MRSSLPVRSRWDALAYAFFSRLGRLRNLLERVADKSIFSYIDGHIADGEHAYQPTALDHRQPADLL
ncbi:MAG: hypothetical protein AVDCRST_MAG26-4147, partial [uncultured Chloroflexia bacterium]